MAVEHPLHSVFTMNAMPMASDRERDMSSNAAPLGGSASLARALDSQIEEFSPNGLITLLEGPDIDRARSEVGGYG